jgi:hypothetical protein
VIPAPFRSLRALRVLNVTAVGLALAAVVAAVFGMGGDPKAPFATGMPTLVVGTLWALLLRWPRTIKNTSFRVGWVTSVPLAALNGGVACALVMGDSSSFPPLAAFVAGATFGAMVWLPALLLTLLCFGLPIASAQRLAARGLAGEERGERIVGLACATMSALALAGASIESGSPHQQPFLPLIYGLAVLGLVTGGTASLLANAREARRRRFVACAEAGEDVAVHLGGDAAEHELRLDARVGGEGGAEDGVVLGGDLDPGHGRQARGARRPWPGG